MNTPPTPRSTVPTDAVTIRALTKVFRDFWGRPRVTAVDKLDLTIPKGCVFGLLGPNGSGKSTTIKMLLGLLHPSSGTATLLGGSFKQRDIRSRIGYLPEVSALHPFLTPRETLNFYAKLFDLDRKARRTRTEQLLEMVGLSKAADRPIGAFSKGMARRVGLAQALINDPELIILDEPTSGLDPLGRRQVKDLILMLGEQGRTVLLCSHLLAEVEDVCTRIAVLHGGILRAEGTVSELLASQRQTQLLLRDVSPDRAQVLADRLAKEEGTQVDVASRSVDLERFFLQTVEDATRDRGDAGDGAAQGTLAPFLSMPGSDSNP